MLVTDVVSAITKSIQTKNNDGKIYEIGGPQIYTFKELIEILLKVIKKKRFLISTRKWRNNLTKNLQLHG